MGRSWRLVTGLGFGAIVVVALSFSGTLWILRNLAPTPEGLFDAVPGVIFTVDPPIRRACEPPIVGKVSWQVTVAGTKTVEVYLSTVKGEVPFYKEGIVATVSTGPWLAAHTILILRDADTKKQLAKYNVASQSCN